MPDLSALGNYPVLQFMFGLGDIGLAYIAGAKGLTEKPSPQPSRTEIHFDGPLKKVSLLFERMTLAIERARTDRNQFNEWMKDFGESSSEAKRRLYQEIDDRVKAEAVARKEDEARLR